ncbi:hypothetical protein ACN38_g3921 [Penicillium nordicum]|uniref:Uncharacterized protein n=1 Tax=Penicillium nordicum TaxID=229535 RepID=A0A0M9WHK9_9EURO|nr:hypothetical protein ACN38_g3921 [Penicillium nordicum]
MLPDKRLYIAQGVEMINRGEAEVRLQSQIWGRHAVLTNDAEPNSANKHRHLRGSSDLPFLLIRVEYNTS